MREFTEQEKTAILMQVERGMTAQQISDSFHKQGMRVSIGDVMQYLKTEKTRARRYVNNFIVWNGYKRTVSEWSLHTGLSRQTITQRILKGWELDRVFTQEVRLAKNNVSKLRTA